jgi:hypothetical protein
MKRVCCFLMVFLLALPLASFADSTPLYTYIFVNQYTKAYEDAKLARTKLQEPCFIESKYEDRTVEYYENSENPIIAVSFPESVRVETIGLLNYSYGNLPDALICLEAAIDEGKPFADNRASLAMGDILKYAVHFWDDDKDGLTYGLAAINPDTYKNSLMKTHVFKADESVNVVYTSYASEMTISQAYELIKAVEKIVAHTTQ